jgi:hypothetical protein
MNDIQCVLNLIHTSAFISNLKVGIEQRKLHLRCNTNVEQQSLKKNRKLKLLKNLKSAVHIVHCNSYYFNYKQSSIATIHLYFHGHTL